MKLFLHLQSLQTRLLVLLLTLVTVVWLGAAAMMWVDARHELDELLDGHLAQAAALLVAQQGADRTEDEGNVADAPSLHKYAPLVAFQVFHEGQLGLHSANAGLQPMSSKTKGFDTVRLSDGELWRVFAARGSESDMQVYVAERLASRGSILWAVLRSMLLPLVIALPVLALLVWWAVRQGLMPLRQISQLLTQRQPQALQPVVLQDAPAEIAPVVQALNALFERIDAMLTSERRFTADAAHELRTPIAAIRAQAQVALGAGADAAQRSHALQSTLAGCDRATRLVDQLLTLARLDAQPIVALSAVQSSTAPVNLSALVRAVAADLATSAIARQQTLELQAEDACPVSGDEALIRVLVRNLIDNALRYSPEGARVLVSVASESGQPVLRVQDSGPGMTEPEQARLGERFYRGLGNQQPGSGLGWSIIKRIAAVVPVQLHVGQSAALGGLEVVVRWG